MHLGQVQRLEAAHMESTTLIGVRTPSHILMGCMNEWVVLLAGSATP